MSSAAAPATTGQQAAVELADADTLALRGALTFATAAAVYRDGIAALEQARPRRLALGGIGEADSAGLACVLALLAAGRRRRPDFAVAEAPANLRALARVSDAEGWLG